MRYKLGIELYRGRRFAEAAREFQVAWAMYPKSARLAFNLARCEERGTNIEAALRAYEAYLRLAPEADDRVAVEATVAALRKRVEALWPEVTIASVPAGAAVSIDGRGRPDPTPSIVRLKPGTHVVKLTLAGHQTASRTLEVEKEKTAALSVSLEAATPTGRPWAWTALGVGAAGVVAGAIFATLLHGDLGTEETSRTSGTTAELEEAQAAANRDVVLMQVSFGLGVVGLATGVTLWFVEDADPVTAGVLPGGGFVRVRF